MFDITQPMMLVAWLVLGGCGHLIDMLACRISDVSWCKLDMQRSLCLVVFGGPCYLAAAFLNFLVALVRDFIGMEDLSDEGRWQFPDGN